MSHKHQLSPEIITTPEMHFVGMSLTMSYANNRVVELWRSFGPARKRIQNTLKGDSYSMEVYGADFFQSFDPNKEFEKWAAVRVNQGASVPEGMRRLTIPESQYAVFEYKGSSSHASGFYQQLYGVWLPTSGFVLDDRPHFAVMGEKYKNNDPESEEQIWIPICTKSNQ
ncbi:MAG: GyrI-like domain-containing protein [Cyclobacteriaceae bacterium]